MNEIMSNIFLIIFIVFAVISSPFWIFELYAYLDYKKDRPKEFLKKIKCPLSVKQVNYWFIVLNVIAGLAYLLHFIFKSNYV